MAGLPFQAPTIPSATSLAPCFKPGTCRRPWNTSRIDPVPSARVHSRLALAVRVGTRTEWTLPAIRTRWRHWTVPIGVVPATFGTGRVNSEDTRARARAWRRAPELDTSPERGLVVLNILESPRTRPAHVKCPRPLLSW